MKKLFALTLALALALSCSASLAEGLQTAEITVDPPEGSSMMFEELGIFMTIPDVLVQTDVPEDLAETSIFDCYTLADGSAYMMLGGYTMTSADDINDLIATLEADADYSELGILTINGVGWLTYAKEASNLLMFTTKVDDFALTVYSSPYNDEGFRAVMLQILGSLTLI